MPVVDSGYTPYPFDTDAETLFQDGVNFLATNIDGWTPSGANLEVLLLRVAARYASTVGAVAASTSPGVFDEYGQDMFKIPRVRAAKATVSSTWTVQDTAGYTIPAGTSVGYRLAGDLLVPFATREDVTIPTGSTTTQPGEVLLEAASEGIEGNSVPLGGVFEVLDPLIYVTHVASTTASAGGVDEETPTDYRDRLAEELRLLSPRPIVASDYGVIARRFPGVYRAFGVAGYNPADGTTNNPGRVGIAALDQAGAGLSNAVRDGLLAYVQTLREPGITISYIPPSQNNLAVTAQIKVLDGYNEASVCTSVSDRLASYLNSGTWAGGDFSPPYWDPTAVVVRPFHLGAVVENVPGVEYVNSVTVNGSSNNYTMSGVAPLPHLTVAPTVTAI